MSDLVESVMHVTALIGTPDGFCPRVAGQKQLDVGQFGRGSIPDNLHDICDKRSILYRPLRFQADLHGEMQKAHLIISHCGAGSIIEAIDLMKPLIVVVNSSSQGNHQGELSDKFFDGGHCLAMTTSHLFDCLQKIITCEI